MQELLKAYNLQDKALKIKKLEGYGSLNYYVKTAKFSFVIKYHIDPNELVLIVAETKLLNSIAPKLPFQIPLLQTPIKTHDQQSFSRLLQYIDGQLLADAEPTDQLMWNFGKAMGQLNRALANKRSTAIEARRFCWDTQYCLLNKPKVQYIQQATQRKLLIYFFDLFEYHVLPIQHALRHAIIHGDLNQHNTLVADNEIVGFIDFGDVCYAPLIYELSIALAYILLISQEDALQKVCTVLKGYHSIHPLLAEEIKLLYYLIPIRLCVSVANSSEAQANGTATEYIIVNEQKALSWIEKWISYNPIGIQNQFLAALNLPMQQFSIDNILKKREQHIGKALSLSYEQPIYMTGAAFQYMYDHAGNAYLDAYNNIPHVGHCHPKISQAISRQVRKLNTNTRYVYEGLTNYATKLLTYFPDQLSQIFFVNSGSEASDLALRMASAYHYQNSPYYAVLEHGYHGHTRAGINASSHKFDGKGGTGCAEHIIRLPLPKLYKGKFNNTNDYIQDAIQRLQTAINLGKSPAAFIAEPISGCGGQVPLADGYMKEIQAFLQQNQVLIIMDEVQTGFGRLGSHFWGFELHGIQPDIVILGKPMGNGHPIGAVVTTQKIADAFANGMEFFSSFGGNPVSCAVASSVLQIIEEEQLQQNALETGNYFLAELQKLQTAFPCMGDVRGHGLFVGIELVTEMGEPATKLANTIKNRLKEKFILTSTDGPFNNVIKMKPPLCFNRKNVDQVIVALQEVLKKHVIN